jgi:hypothetical protein
MSNIISIPDVEATVVDRLQRAGATIVSGDERPEGTHIVVDADGELHRIVVRKPQDGSWIIAAGTAAAIALLTWTAMAAAFVPFYLSSHG